MRPYYDYGDDRTRSSSGQGAGYNFGGPLTPAVKWIIGATIVAFIFEYLLGGPDSYAGRRLMEWFGFTPAEAIGRLWLWQFVTYVFLHNGFAHVFFNLFFFWMIGGLVEERLGTRRFVWLYFLSGAVGGLAQAAVAYDATTVGASGAIMGIAAAVAMLYPDMTVLLFFIIPVKMKYFVWVLVLFQVWGLSAAAGAAGGTDNTAYFAHLAGLGAGYLFIKWHRGATWGLSRIYYRIKARTRGFQGFTGAPKVTHIDDDAKYREEVDRLLDKIFREGTQSLTKEESDFLRKQSERFKK